MKPVITTNNKMSGNDMTPLQIFPDERPQKRGLSMKHVVMAVSGVLALAIIVTGFIAGFYLFKRTSDQQSDAITKIFQMRVRYGERVADEVVKTNIGEGTTEVDTKDDQGRDAIIYNDFHKGVTLFVTGGDDPVCFISPINTTDTKDPQTLQKYMQSHPNPKARQETGEVEMVAADNPVSDSTFLGPKMNKMCASRDIFWVYPKQALPENPRQKRGCWTVCVRVCRNGRCAIVCRRRCS